MSIWTLIDIIFTALDWLGHWRFTLCLWGSFVLAFVVASNMPNRPLQWIVGGLIFIPGVIFGHRWNSSN